MTATGMTSSHCKGTVDLDWSPLGCTVLVKAKLPRDQLSLLLGTLHEESSSGSRILAMGFLLLPCA